MKKVYFLIVIVVSGLSRQIAIAQTSKIDSNSWFYKRFFIGQSMATADQQALPAEFLITMPQHQSASYLVNVGVSLDVPGLSTKKNALGFIAEYHRNTLTDSVQNNLQLGLKGSFRFARSSDYQTSYFLVYDPQYTSDQVKKQNTLATDLLFTWRTIHTNFNWDAINMSKDSLHYIKPLFSIGTQLQQVFPSDTNMAKGFKIRPLAAFSVSYVFLRGKKDNTDPLIQLYAGYTQRIAAVNHTNDHEKFSHLVKASINYYFLTSPILISIGGSFIDGSDFFTGLKQQQYFLISLNVSKTKP